jgi:hypothetical protein
MGKTPFERRWVKGTLGPGRTPYFVEKLEK